MYLLVTLRPKYIEISKNFSNPVCYQDKLNSLSQTEGIVKEMKCAAYLTIIGMYNLILNAKKYKNILILKYEDLVYNYNNSITQLCNFLDLNNSLTKKIRVNCLQHNLIYQKNNNNITNHTTNKDVKLNRYLNYWNEDIEKQFTKLFPINLMNELGY